MIYYYYWNEFIYSFQNPPLIFLVLLSICIVSSMMIEELKLIANKRDVPYQSLMKMFLAERVEQELHK